MSEITFDCFGSSCTVIVRDARRPSDARAAVLRSRARLLEWHAQFSRFEPDSELSRFNRDPRATVPVSPMMARVVAAGLVAGERTGGLVDITLGEQIVRAGYVSDLAAPGVDLTGVLALAGRRTPAASSGRAASGRAASGRAASGRAASGRAASGLPVPRIAVDRRAGTLTRPPGTVIDLCGIAKGVFADELAAGLASFDSFAVDCAGDLRVGGTAGYPRPVLVESPSGGSILHTFQIRSGAVATSGIARRRWSRADGRPAHHLLDPATGEPAFTGVVQATALAPTAAEAEARGKAAVLSGPAHAPGWLQDGGLLVLDDGTVLIYEPHDVATPAAQAQAAISSGAPAGPHRAMSFASRLAAA